MLGLKNGQTLSTSSLMMSVTGTFPVMVGKNSNSNLDRMAAEGMRFTSLCRCVCLRPFTLYLMMGKHIARAHTRDRGKNCMSGIEPSPISCRIAAMPPQ